MNKIDLVKKEILRMFSIEDLKRTFTRRLDDKMFLRIGQRVLGRDARNKPNCFLIFTGYEYLTDSKYLNLEEV